MTATQTILSGSLAPHNGENNKTVTTASGRAATCINGVLLPLGFLDLSLNDAMRGSVTASNTRPNAEINPRIVMNPPMTKPGMRYCVAPLAMSPAVGK